LTRAAIISANMLLLTIVVGAVALGSRADHATSMLLARDAVAPVSPVDRMTSYDVAANVAKAAGLYEATAVTNQAQSAKVAVAMSSSDTAIAAKPQVVSTALKSWRDIREYTVKEGDNVPNIAQKFGVTSESIRWSNSLTGDALSIGNKLIIPPMNGIVYTVKANDTAQTLAAKYRANADQIAQYNDAEQSGLVIGRRIIIPNGQVVPVATYATASRITQGTATAGFTPQYGGNGYDFGWCTYYAAARSGAPGNWGNANTWAYYAARSGWTVSSRPVAGAIFQTPAGWAGHVGIVEEVSADGSQIKISDMNGIAGFGRVGYSGWISAGTYPNYIYR
jgi:surface antigen